MFFHNHFLVFAWLSYNILVVTSLNFLLNIDKLFLVLIFFQISILMKNKIIDSQIWEYPMNKKWNRWN